MIVVSKHDHLAMQWVMSVIERSVLSEQEPTQREREREKELTRADGRAARAQHAQLSAQSYVKEVFVAYTQHY